MNTTMTSTSSGKARMALRTCRTTFEMRPLDTFLAPKKPIGSDRAAPMMVPTHAIQIESSMPSAAVGR
jgi:hypothetical protein